jgi:hypothetical protein
VTRAGLALAAATTLAAAATLAACRPLVSTPAGPDRAPADPHGLDPDLLAGLVRETERARQLELLEPVDASTLDDAELREYVEGELARVELDVSRSILVAFGFVPADVDLRRTMVDLLAAEVVGLYDPRTDRLFVRRDVAASLATPSEAAQEARMVLVHELTHALQDQHFQTLDDGADEAWSDDAESVVTCLAEGDATTTMIVAALARGGAPDRTLQPGLRAALRQSGTATIPGSDALRVAPPYFAHVLAAAYLEGAAFVSELRSVGGWAAVDEAHREPPRATRDVLHTDRYLAGDALVEVELPPTLPPLDGAGWRRGATAVLGELETGAFLLPLDDPARLWSAADGWVGDRFVVYESPQGAPALVWRLRFASAAEAAELAHAAADATVAAGRGPCDPRPGAGDVALWCEGGADWIQSTGADVVVLRGMPGEAAALEVARLVASAPAIARPGVARPGLLARWRALHGPAISVDLP